MGLSDTAAVCAACGQPARVQVLEGYASGKPVRWRLCLSCVDSQYERYLRAGAEIGRPRLSISSGLLFAGALLALLGVSADQMTPLDANGFGWRQWSGLLTGVLFITLGAMLRVDIVGIAGAVLSAVAILANYLGHDYSPGIGWKQALAIIVGFGFVATGLKLRKRELESKTAKETAGQAENVCKA